MSAVGERRHAENPRVRAKLSSLGEKDIMEQRAASRLRKSPYPEVRRVACEFHEGLLFLRGRVPSYYLKQIAQTVVLGMDGVDEIHNQLEVITPPDWP
jgi:osmotically-inducible protein OsmY